MDKTVEKMLNSMIYLLDTQLSHCIDAGAKADKWTLKCPVGGNEDQNNFYFGHLNMAQMLAWDAHKDIVKHNGKHILIDEK